MIAQPVPVSPIRFERDNRIVVGKIAYRCIDSDERGHRFARVDDPDIIEGFSHARMEAIERQPDYRYDPGWFREAKVKARQRSGVERWADIPQKEMPQVLLKWEYCHRFRRMELAGSTNRSHDSIERAIAKISVEVNEIAALNEVLKRRKERAAKKAASPRKDGKPRKPRVGTRKADTWQPSVRSLERWLSILEEHEWDPMTLQDGYRNSGNRQPRLTPEAHNALVIRAVEFAAPNTPERQDLYDLLEGDIRDLNAGRAEEDMIPVPSKRRFYKEIASLDPFWVYARRKSLDAAKKKFPMLGNGPDVTRVGQRVEMDEWKVPLQTLLVKSGAWRLMTPEERKAVGKERWWLYVAIDVASRCVLGMRLSPTPKAMEACATLQMAVRDKQIYSDAVGALKPWFMATGIGTLVTDWGSSYSSDAFRRAALGLGATFEHPPAGMSYMRPYVERMFATIHTGLISRFSGRTFANIVQKGDYNSEANASVPLEELAWALVRYVVDDYHNRPHEGLGGETPRAAWIRLTREFGRIGLPDRDTQRAIFGILLTRKLSNGGVRILGLRYQSKELHEWLLRKGSVDLEIRLDPEDIGRVSVKLGPDWVAVPCLKPEFDGVSLRTWLEASSQLKSIHGKAAALVRPIVLEAVRAIEKLSRDLQEQAGIASELGTPEEIEQAEKRLTIAFTLPDWPDEPDGPASGDLLDGVIPVGVPPVVAGGPPALPPPSETAAQAEEEEPDETDEPGWHMGNRKDSE